MTKYTIMKRVFTISLITYFTFPVFNNFKPVNAQSSCQATINSVVNDIKSRGVRNVILQDRKINDYRDDNPTNRTESLTLTLSSYSHNRNRLDKKSIFVVENIMVSTVLMKSYADKIVYDCSNYADVGFGKDGTDWFVDYAIQSNGKTKQRSCVSPDPNVQLTWNQTICF